MNRRALDLLWVGDELRPEFHGAARWLASVGRMACVPSADAALRRLAAEGEPDLIVLAQARPGQHPLGQVKRLQSAAPSARLVGLLGSWCEGETRTGSPWPGVERLFWYDGEAQLEAVVRSLAQCSLPPATPPRRARGLVVLCVRSYHSAEALSDVCRQRGYSTAWLRPDPEKLLSHTTGLQRAAAILWEGGRVGPAEEAELRWIARGWPGVPLVALVDFPRLDDCQRAQSAGAACVLARPVSIDDLAWHLARLNRPSQRLASRDGRAA